jgi:prepilin-type N-terminal cleavage/methylation domain-containing protein
MNKQKRPALSLSKGFTLIELVVVIAIIAVLSGIVLFSVTQYINNGKDSNITANLSILIPAGETFYNIENGQNGDGYNYFCDIDKNSVIKNALAQLPDQISGTPCYDDTMPYSGNISVGNPKGVCCNVAGLGQNYQSWAACAKEFSKTNTFYCVDSRGVKEEMTCACTSSLTQCPDLSTCP